MRRGLLIGAPPLQAEWSSRIRAVCRGGASGGSGAFPAGCGGKTSVCRRGDAGGSHRGITNEKRSSMFIGLLVVSRAHEICIPFCPAGSQISKVTDWKTRATSERADVLTDRVPGQRPNAVAGASRSIAKVECAGCVAVNRLPPIRSPITYIMSTKIDKVQVGSLPATSELLERGGSLSSRSL